MQINPGELNKKIQIIEQQTDALDDDGFSMESVHNENGVSYPTVRSCAASFRRTSGTELVKAGKEITDIKCRFLIRKGKTEITEKMQIVYAGDIYDILYINDYEDSHRYVEIWCRKVK